MTKEQSSNKDIAYTRIPGREPIELVDFYPEFRDYYPNCELQTKRWFIEHIESDWQIFDVGANIGYYSILFSRLAPEGRVHAFEPTETIDMLRRNLAHAGCKNVACLKVALGAKVGELEEDIFRIWGKDAERLTYRFSTVDAIVQELGVDRLDCIKIDVDSYDLEVLWGARQTLDRLNPWVVVELNHALAKRAHGVGEALEWLASRGYDKALVLDGENFALRRTSGGQKAPAERPSIEISFETRPVFLSEALKKSARLSLFEMEPRCHAAGSCVRTPAGTYVIGAPGPRWSYAVTWPRNAVGKMETGLAIVEVKLTVSGAMVSLGCLDRSFNTYCTDEMNVGPASDPVAVSIAIEEVANAAHLVLRNTDGDGKNAQVVVHAIDCYAAAPGSRALKPLFLPNKRVLTKNDLESVLAGGDPVATAGGESSIGIVDVDRLGLALEWRRAYSPARRALHGDLRNWRMEKDDAPILSYLFENFHPVRHLEFGTWEGFGATLVAQACDAHVWTMNLADGEIAADGTPVYTGSAISDLPKHMHAQLQQTGKTDAGDFIGWRYRAAGFADRVTQILCDSRELDKNTFAEAFFDSILIDGGHMPDVVTNDTDKALRWLRPGGLILWHDFCPDPRVLESMSSARGVVTAVHDNWDRWLPQLRQAFWIRPSWILVGIKA